MRLNIDPAVPGTKTLFANVRKNLGTVGVPNFQRAGVPATGADDLPYVGAAEGFLPLVEAAMVLTQLPAALQADFLVRNITVTGGAVGYAVAEKQAARPISIQFDNAGLSPFKFVALTVLANEAWNAGGPVTERAVQNALVSALADVVNAYVLSDDAASAAAPAGLGFGVAPIGATADPTADIRALIEAHSLTADLTTSAFITDPTTAAVLGTVTGADGGLLFPDVGVNGGSILGLPLITTKGSPRDGSPATTGSLYLIDGAAITFALDGIELALAKHATVEMDEAPTGDGDTPASASASMVSLWQNELSAAQIVARASWKAARSGAVSILNGISY